MRSFPETASLSSRTNTSPPGQSATAPRILVVQPVVPAYRRDFFDRLHAAFGDRFMVLASYREMAGLTSERQMPAWERRIGRIRAVAPGLQWQPGAFSADMAHGDIVVISGAPRCLSNIALLAKARLKGARSVWWGHYWSTTSKAWRAAMRLFLANFSDALLFYTDAERTEYLRRFGDRRACEVFALNNGMDNSQIAALRRPYDAAGRENRLLFIGRLTRKARLDLLLRALAENADAAHIACDIVGDGEMGADLRELARDLGLESRIVWHGSTTDETAIAAIANRCRLFVYPGACGLSLIHGLCYGLPAIVHDDRWKQGPETAALSSGSNGMLFEAGNARSLAKTIIEALSDAARLDRMAAEAVATTDASYNTKAMADRFAEMAKVLGGAAGTAPASACEGAAE